MINDTFEQQYYKTRNPKSKSKKVISSHVNEILSVARTYIKKTTKEIDVLDVGSGQGEYSFELGKKVKSVVGVEPYKSAHEVAAKNSIGHLKVKFFNIPVEDLKINKKFDLVICLTVIEHMPDAKKSFKKIFKLLKRDGIIYLTAPNKLWPLESHHKLLFLSWLPLPIANLYVKLTGKANSYQDSSYSKTYFGTRKFFDSFPCRYEFVLPKNLEGVFMGCGSGGRFYRFVMKTGILLIRKFSVFWLFSKGFIIVVRKEN